MAGWHAARLDSHQNAWLSHILLNPRHGTVEEGRNALSRCFRVLAGKMVQEQCQASWLGLGARRLHDPRTIE
jgi:hypothetical protein